MLVITGGAFLINQKSSIQVSPATQVGISPSFTTTSPDSFTLTPGETTTLPPISTTTPTSTGGSQTRPYTATATSTLANSTQVATAVGLSGAFETLATLQNTTVHVNDPLSLVERLEGKQDVPLTLSGPAVTHQVGDVEQFWVSNEDTNQEIQVNATLRYVGQHLYFWIQNGVTYNSAALKQLASAFDDKIYPTDRQFFGSEWTPGVDNDPHIYVLYARHLGSMVAGYFSSQDEYTPQVFHYSNAHEMFDINADVVSIAESYVYSTLAHEFQHMIHWNLDRNEDLWLDEGFSVLAQFINGYTVGGYDTSYAAQPDTQLNDWALDQAATAPHYGAAFLYLDYILSRFGAAITQAIVNSPLHGLQSIDSVLSSHAVQDADTGKTMTADDLFADWTVANYLHNPNIYYGQYDFSNDPQAPAVHDSSTIKICPAAVQTYQVHQYAADYIDITCEGTYTLNFSSLPMVSLVPIQSYSGSYDFWSNKGDQSDMTLTRAFDFTKASAPLSMSYEVWFDLEPGYDYAYLEASTDDTNWQILTTPSCTSPNQNGSSYGCGYTGSSDRWLKETVDLSDFAGKKVWLRFEYLTDAALNGDGLLIDDISVSQVNYFTDFEQDNGGWQADGFARVQNIIPQSYRLSLILIGNTTTVQQVTLDSSRSASFKISIGTDVQKAVLVVSGTTRYTRQTATYQVSITK